MISFFNRTNQFHIELRYLNASLHETPDRMPQLIQDQIDEIKSYASQIVLGYGLCSNVIVGLKASMQDLINDQHNVPI